MNLRKTSILVLCGLMSYDSLAALPSARTSTLRLGSSSADNRTSGTSSQNRATASVTNYNKAATSQARASTSKALDTITSNADSIVELKAAMQEMQAQMNESLAEKDEVIEALRKELNDYKTEYEEVKSAVEAMDDTIDTKLVGFVKADDLTVIKTDLKAVQAKAEENKNNFKNFATTEDLKNLKVGTDESTVNKIVDGKLADFAKVKDVQVIKTDLQTVQAKTEENKKNFENYATLKDLNNLEVGTDESTVNKIIDGKLVGFAKVKDVQVIKTDLQTVQAKTEENKNNFKNYATLTDLNNLEVGTDESTVSKIVDSKLVGFAKADDLKSFDNKLVDFAKKDDLKGFATTEDLKNLKVGADESTVNKIIDGKLVDFAKADDLKIFDNKLVDFAKKDDLKGFATTDDLKNLKVGTDESTVNKIIDGKLVDFAKIDLLKDFATTDDLKVFAKTDDLKGFAQATSVADLITRVDTIDGWKGRIDLIDSLKTRIGNVEQDFVTYEEFIEHSNKKFPTLEDRLVKVENKTDSVVTSEELEQIGKDLEGFNKKFPILEGRIAKIEDNSATKAAIQELLDVFTKNEYLSKEYEDIIKSLQEQLAALSNETNTLKVDFAKIGTDYRAESERISKTIQEQLAEIRKKQAEEQARVDAAIAEIKDGKNGYFTQIASLREELNRLLTSGSDDTRLIEALQAAIKELQDQMTANLKTMEGLKVDVVKVKNYAEDINAIKNAIATLEALGDDLFEDQIAELKNKLAELEKKNNTFSDQFARFTGEFGGFKGRLERAELKISEVDTKAGEAAEAATEAQNTANNAQNTVNNTQNDSSSKWSQNTQWQNRVNQWMADAEKREQERAAAEEARIAKAIEAALADSTGGFLSSTKSDLEALQKALEQLQKDGSNDSALIAAFQDKIAELEQKLKEEQEAWSKRVAELQAEYERKLAEEKARVNAAIAEITEGKNHNLAQLLALQKELKELTQSGSDDAALIAALQAKIAELQEQLTANMKLVENLNVRVKTAEDYKKDIVDIQNAIDALKELGTDNTYIADQIKALEEELAKLEEAKDNMDERFAGFSTTLGGLTDRLGATEAKLVKVETKTDKTAADVEETKSDLSANEKDIAEFKTWKENQAANKDDIERIVLDKTDEAVKEVTTLITANEKGIKEFREWKEKNAATKEDVNKSIADNQKAINDMSSTFNQTMGDGLEQLRSDFRDEMQNYATKSSLDNYVPQSELTRLTGTMDAKFKNLSNLYAPVSVSDQLQAVRASLSDYAKASALSAYATKSDLGDYVKTSALGAYATKSYVNDYALKLESDLTKVQNSLSVQGTSYSVGTGSGTPTVVK